VGIVEGVAEGIVGSDLGVGIVQGVREGIVGSLGVDGVGIVSLGREVLEGVMHGLGMATSWSADGSFVHAVLSAELCSGSLVGVGVDLLAGTWVVGEVGSVSEGLGRSVGLGLVLMVTAWSVVLVWGEVRVSSMLLCVCIAGFLVVGAVLGGLGVSEGLCTLSMEGSLAV